MTSPSFNQSIRIGALGFCIASLIVFATVAFAERWMFRNLGLYGAYAAWTFLFIILGGTALRPLVIDPRQRRRFFLIFTAAFLAYAAAWMGGYFTLRGAIGEWVGSLAGSFLMGLVLALAFGAPRSLARLIAVLILGNCAGYFLGAALFYSVGGEIGMLLYGLVYGLFVGTGLGAAIYFAQAPIREGHSAAQSTSETG